MKHLIPIDENLPNFFLVLGENGGTYPYSHSLLVKTNEKKAILFDSGFGHDRVRKVLTELKITKVFLSHWHEDHISGNFLLRKEQAKFYSHPLDARLLNDISQFQTFYDTVGSSMEDFFQEIIISMNLENLTEIDEVIDNQMIEIGDTLTIKVIHTPGHSAGHCCYYEPNLHLVFLADIDLSGLGPWYGCLDSNLEDFIESIKRLMQIDIEYAISSHKGIFISSKEIKRQLLKFLNIIDLRDNKILEELSEDKPRSIEDLIGKGIIYRNYKQMKEYLFIAERQMISKHLLQLVKRELILKNQDKFLLA
ncbi:MAG: MBL fold metallo-hydrolase [Candidatus Heimdallarchaeota archaeon]|nr:MAG: MBL fold metallo-hydrolase [Candidatus Heimdallarchaeota archaeon]